ncbi:MAG: hypothetical protein JWP69_671 [Flaviaesturariibacter sp.]|nr:hypothetical protein [Flaviaesturariibacter sp.]
MNPSKRFQDKDLTTADFYGEVAVECPACRQKALATADYENHLARLVCSACGYNKQASGKVTTGTWKGALLTLNANAYFRAALWFKAPFKKEILWAYNLAHLEYLESYIASGIRENRNRTRFTLAEKLPRYMQVAKNRVGLLKAIQKLKEK